MDDTDKLLRIIGKQVVQIDQLVKDLEEYEDRVSYWFDAHQKLLKELEIAKGEKPDAN